MSRTGRSWAAAPARYARGLSACLPLVQRRGLTWWLRQARNMFKQREAEQKKASKGEDKAKAEALKARTIHVQKPAAGWEQSPSTKLAAANWGLIETLGQCNGEATSPVQLMLIELMCLTSTV